MINLVQSSHDRRLRRRNQRTVCAPRQDAATEPPFGNIKRQMNKLMDQMQKGFFTFSPNETWTPNVNLYENDASYVVCVDLAGVVKEEIDLNVDKNTLTLRGSRAVPIQSSEDSSEATPSRYRVHLMEIDHGHFVRDVELPHDVHSEQITASYRNGMLWIELPKKK
jgi:HSP20 family protein